MPIPTITITAPVTAIGNTSYGLVFNGNSALTEVDLPPELTMLGVQAFYNDKNLNRVKLRSERPPTISGTAFQDDGKVRLYVPRFSNYWEAFIAENVTPMTEAQTNAFVAAFPDYPYRPLGKYVNGSNNIYVFDKAAVLYNTYDIKSLFASFPAFKQDGLDFITYGKSIVGAMKESGLEIALQAPTPEIPSVIKALDIYLQNK